MNKTEQMAPGDLLTTDEAAKLLAVASSTLRQWRWAKEPSAPPFILIGRRAIRYERRVLQEYLDRGRVSHQAGNGRGGSQ